VVRHRRPRRGLGPARRRRCRRRDLVAVDLLAQRAHRCGARAAGAGILARDARSRENSRPPGPRTGELRSLRDRLGACEREQRRLDEPADRHRTQPRRDSHGRLRSLGAPGSRADAAHAVLP
jgi:hypothetical protein